MTRASGFSEELLAPTAALLRAYIAVDAAITRRAAQPAGLEPSVADLVIRLSTSDGNSLRGVDIGRQLMANPTKVSRLVDRAETQGLVERLPDPTDRRAQKVTLTKTGRNVAADFAPLLTKALQEMLHEPFSKNELNELIRLLDKLTKSARRIATQTSQTNPKPRP